MQGSYAKKKPENIADFLSLDSISNKESTFDMRDSLRIPYTLEMNRKDSLEEVNSDIVDLNEEQAKRFSEVLSFIGDLDRTQAFIAEHKEDIFNAVINKTNKSLNDQI